jgi:hypothetical protein
MLQARRLRVQIPMRLLDFSFDLKPFQPHYGLGVGSASNRNEYQESSWGIKLTISSPINTGFLDFVHRPEFYN